MKVKKDYLGKLLHCGLTAVLDRLCPWRPCFRAHDFGYTNSQGHWVQDGRCWVSAARGCPSERTFRTCCDSPRFAPVRRNDQHKVCRNCGLRVPVEVIHSLTANVILSEEVTNDLPKVRTRDGE